MPAFYIGLQEVVGLGIWGQGIGVHQFPFLQTSTMQAEGEPSRGKRGYISKQLAALNNQNHQFSRSKKGIKKDNKHICRDAREKKKMYLAGLQKIKQQQEQEIKALRQQVEMLRQKIETPLDTGVKDLITEFKELMRGLTIKDDTLIKRSLTVLRSRFGIAGRDRTKWMQEHLQRMVELAMPMHFRLLLENCDNSKAFFQLLGAGDQMKACRVSFSEDKKSILKQMKPKIKKTKQIYNKTLLKLHEAWTELQKNGQQSQKIIDEIEQKVNHPVFIGNLLMTLDSQRSKNETIYPLNYFTQLSRATAPDEYEFHYSPIEEPEDRPAFDFYFNDFN